MDTFELNKIAGAFLGTLLLAMFLNVISTGIFTPPKLVKPGYPLPSAPGMAAGEAHSATPAAAPIAQRLATADVQKGQADTKPCQSCHNFEKGAPVKIGPPLYGVVNRPKASVAGFDYSGALSSKGGDWTYADLDQFLTNPQAYAHGTKMTFAGETDPAKRADIIDYLRSLSDNPAPLPAKGATKSTPSAIEPTLPLVAQPKEQAVSDNPQPLPASSAGVTTAGARTEPHLSHPKVKPAETKPIHRAKLASHTRK